MTKGTGTLSALTLFGPSRCFGDKDPVPVCPGCFIKLLNLSLLWDDYTFILEKLSTKPQGMIFIYLMLA